MDENIGNYSLLAEYNGRLVGTVLAFVNQYQKNGQRYSACISTGLTSDPSMRGKRMAQLLNHTLYETFINDGYDFGMFWFDSRFNAAGSSFQIYKKENKRIHAIVEKKIFGKFLDYHHAVKLLSLTIRQKAILKAGATFFSSGNKIPRGLEIRVFDRSMLSEVILFLESYQADNAIHRIFPQKEMDRKFNFHGKNCQSVTYILKKNGHIKGLIYGITNPILPTYTYLQVEAMLFHPSLSYKEQSIFVSAYENAVRRQYNCFAVVVPSTVLNDRIQKFGYVSIVTQALGAFFYNDRLGYDETPLKNMHAELR